MKRLLGLLLCLCLLLSGCGSRQNRIMDPVVFYYLPAEMPYGSGESILVPETREGAGHRNNLTYLLALYQLGPVSEKLRSPMPNGVHVRSVEREGAKITLTLGDPGYLVPDSSFTLMCACLTMTCLELTDASTVSITCGSQTATMTRESLILFDNITTSATEETP